MIMSRLSNATSGLATVTRLGRGIFAKVNATKPEALLELYEFENCPYCRLVREVLTELDLDAIIYPCPKGGQRFRPRVIELGGKAQFPFLVDPNTKEQRYESADIIAYLATTYGTGVAPRGRWRPNALSVASSLIASGYRAGSGLRTRPSNEPKEPLELYSFESSPFARRVRETLCELELPYVLRNVGRTRLIENLPPVARNMLRIDARPTSENRKALMERTGQVMVPYLIDPNSGEEMFESADICAYLNDAYSA